MSMQALLSRKFWTSLIGIWLASGLASAAAAEPVVINEIHFHPEQKKSTEFVELHNYGSQPIDLKGWSLDKFQFADPVIIAPNGFVVLATNLKAFQAEFGIKPHGEFPGELKYAGEKLTLKNAQGSVVDEVRYAAGFPWPTAAAGAGSSLERSSPTGKSNSSGTWRSSGYPALANGAIGDKRPTPGKKNYSVSENLPPTITQVTHQPGQPKLNEAVVVSAEVADADGVDKVALLLQTVEPGKYIRKSDPNYETDWKSFVMHDDGRDGDAKAGDGIFSFKVPPEFQKHRWLNRYRIVATDKGQRPNRAPFLDDTCPNFAWFCDDGIPAWTGASQPGKTSAVTFPAAFFTSLQSFRLIARQEDVTRSQWDGGAHRQPFSGAFVYDGAVYDHIVFHSRGQGSAHIAGKNKWGLKFNRTHDIPMRDNHGRLYADPWDSLNLNPGIYTPYTPVLRGIAGLDEAVSFKSYQLAGVPSSPTHWVQWHVIDSATETVPGNQYEGDLWGLYLVIADLDGAFLKEQKLDDGVLVSIQSGLKHRPRGIDNPQQLWEKFHGGMHSGPNEKWWRDNLDLPAYFSFHALNRLLANVDVRPDGNHGYYRRPDGHWSPVPWDNDMMFVPRHHQPGYVAAIGCLNHAAIKLEYQGRAREILDLFASDASPTGGQIGQLVTDLAAVLAARAANERPAREALFRTSQGSLVTWAQLDEAMWNFHPRMNQKGEYFRNPASSGHFGGEWKRTLITPDFAGFQDYIIRFCTDSRPTKNYAPNDGNHLGYGWGYLVHEARDDQIPSRPTLTEVTSTPSGVRVFRSSKYDSNAKHLPKGAEYRIGRIYTHGLPGWKSGDIEHYEIEDVWRTLPTEQAVALTTGQVSIPTKTISSPGRYRVRVRHQDQTGRWSHWSLPVEFDVLR